MGEEDCKNIIKQVWQQGACDGSVEDLMGHIFDCGSRLKQWNKSCFGHVRQRLAATKRKLIQIQERRHEVASEEEV